MARRRQTFRKGLPGLALSLFVTLAMVLGMCPTAGIAEEMTMGPEGEPVVEVKTKGNEEPSLQAQQADSYNLWVGGVEVTSDNKGNVLADDVVNNGKVSFTPASGQTPATLTLDGVSITKGYDTGDGSPHGIYYTGAGPLTIAVVSDSTVDVSGVEGSDNNGICCATGGEWAGDLTITGAGKLTAKGKNFDIGSNGNVTISNGTVATSGGTNGIFANKMTVTDSAVTVEGSNFGINASNGVTITRSIVGVTASSYGIYSLEGGITIDGGTVKADGVQRGITGNGVVVSGGEVTATASEGDGIFAETNPTTNQSGSVTITGGIVSATGGTNGRGIYAEAECIDHQPVGTPGTVTIGGGVASVTASGGKQAIEGTVRNSVVGMDWTNVAGTKGEASIAINVDGQDLGAYKKAQLPPMAKVTKSPTAINRTYDGGVQALVTAGTAKDGTMVYSLDGKSWSDKVPTATKVGTYTVWYKAAGDAQHADSEVSSVETTIAKAVPEPGTPGPLNAPAGNTLGDVALPAADNGAWSWQDPADTSVGEELGETKTFRARFIPNDTANYSMVENVEVTINVTRPETDASPDANPDAKWFPDVPEGSWFHDVVYRAVELGIFNGYDNGNFGPNDKVTYGQVAVVLWHMVGEPEPGAVGRLSPDVRATMYYADAFVWAEEAGVVSGSIGPDDPVTREQLAVIAANYARRVAGRQTDGSAADYKHMRDADKVSGWAESSVGWCFRNDILVGSGDNVNPQDSADRAEAAKVLVYLHDLLQA